MKPVKQEKNAFLENLLADGQRQQVSVIPADAGIQKLTFGARALLRLGLADFSIPELT